MDRESSPAANPYEQSLEARIAEEAASKIRDWIHDPKLKFHFASVRRIHRIVGEGILSPELAERAGHPFSEDMGSRDPRSISIADRGKNDYHIPEADRNPLRAEAEGADWWMRSFAEVQAPVGGYVGYVLPSDLRVREGTPHPNESLAPIRIKPENIEGIVIASSIDLEKQSLAAHPSAGPYHPRSLAYLEEFWGITRENLFEHDAMLQNLGAEHKAIIADMQRRGFALKDWPRETRVAVDAILAAEGDRLDQVATEYIERLLRKSKDEIRERDFYLFWAKKAHAPLYGIDREMNVKVIWPVPKTGETTTVEIPPPENDTGHR